MGVGRECTLTQAGGRWRFGSPDRSTGEHGVLNAAACGSGSGRAPLPNGVGG